MWQKKRPAYGSLAEENRGRHVGVKTLHRSNGEHTRQGMEITPLATNQHISEVCYLDGLSTCTAVHCNTAKKRLAIGYTASCISKLLVKLRPGGVEVALRY